MPAVTQPRVRCEPRAGDADVAADGAVDQRTGQAGGVEQATEIDPRAHAHRVEGVHEIFEREVAGRARGVGAAAERTDAAIDPGHARLERGEHVGDGQPAGVVQVHADGHRTGQRRGGGHEAPHLGGNGRADRVGQTDPGHPGTEGALDGAEHDDRIDGADERAAERRRQGHLDARVPRGGETHDLVEHDERRVHGRAGVALVVGLGDRHDELQVVETGRQRPLRPPQVQHEPPADRPVVWIGPRGGRGGGDQRFGVGQGRDAIGSHERRQLELGDAGAHERLIERDLVVGGHRRFILQAVTQGDIARRSRRASRPRSGRGSCRWTAWIAARTVVVRHSSVVVRGASVVVRHASVVFGAHPIWPRIASLDGVDRGQIGGGSWVIRRAARRGRRAGRRVPGECARS